jgi:hypothetical protein
MLKGLSKPLIVSFVMAIFIVGCAGRSHQNSTLRVERAPEVGVVVEEPEDSVVFVDYAPKTTFTSIEQMEDIVPKEEGGYELGVVNKKFLKGCYYTGSTSTPFLASFAERYNKTEFLRRFVNAEEIFERENTNVGDSLTTDTVRGEMPLLSNEYQLAFRNANCQARARKLVRMLTTIDYVSEQTDKMASYFQELVNIPYDTPDFLTDEERDATGEDFWTLYDKSKYVANYDEIQKKRLPEDVDYDELQRLPLSLQKKYLAEEDFDAKCIYALEMGCYDFPYSIDYLGELIEDGRYSKYLFEVWISWRLRAQSQVFGISTWSEIPDNLYDNARLLVAKAYAKHIVEDPSDTLAKFLLMNLIYTENLHRPGGYYGNEALGAELMLRTRYFLPEEEENSTE